VNKEIHIDILRSLKDRVRRERHDKWRTNSWLILHDNAPAHRSVLVKDFLAKNNVTTLEHPSGYPDLAAADFYLFPRLKAAMERRRFRDYINIIKNATERFSKMASRKVFNTFTVACRSA